MSLTTEQKQELEQIIETKSFYHWLTEGYASDFTKKDRQLNDKVDDALKAIEKLQTYLEVDLDLEVYF